MTRHLSTLHRLDGGGLPSHFAAGILALIARLPPSDGLCHGDVHPDNVIMTAEGPRLIDWIAAVRAPAALDLGVSHINLSEFAPLAADNPERPRAVNRALQAEYARRTGLSPAALTAAMEPCRPIVDALVILGGAVPGQCERLIERLAAALCSPPPMAL